MNGPAGSNGDIRTRVHRIFLDVLDLDVDVDMDVIQSGVLDSLAFVQLLAELEKAFDIEVDVALVDLESFSSVARIASFVVETRGT